MNLPLDETDFGVTLAKWGLPDGPYLVLPFVGSTTVRDVWRLPVDQYFDPLQWYANEHDFQYNAEYLPNIFYLSRCARAASRPRACSKASTIHTCSTAMRIASAGSTRSTTARRRRMSSSRCRA